tara:strand:- start:502 stop:897 length:396 start_codon:yes stop_codon:yes gene_type:complete
MFTRIARKINLFSRDRSELTKADVAFSYFFILSTFYLITWFSVKYYDKAKDDLAQCQDNKFSCVKSEVIKIVVPFTGIVYGFINTSFKVCDLLASGINYFCCCITCCCCIKKNDNTINIELNNVSDLVNTV